MNSNEIIKNYVETLIKEHKKYHPINAKTFVDVMEAEDEIMYKNKEVTALGIVVDDVIDTGTYEVYSHIIERYDEMKIFDIVTLKWNNHWIFGLFYFRNDKKIFITYSNQELYEIELKD